MADTEAPSPNGQLAGLSALYNRLPPQVQDGIAALVLLAGAVTSIGVMVPELIPATALKLAAAIAAAGAPLGIVSGGTRK
jgi:hypothetical protein